MVKFLKNFGLGVVYALLLPLFIIMVAVFMIYGIVLWFINAFKVVVNFFKAKDIFPQFEEDLQVANIRQAQLDMLAGQGQQPQPQTSQSNTTNSTVYVQQNYYQQPQMQQPQPQPQPQIQQQPAPSLPNSNPFGNAYDADGRWINNQPQEQSPLIDQPREAEPMPGLPHTTSLLENNESIDVFDDQEDEQ